jgi:V/A-type H+-transporting ATPase subunit I
MYGRPAYDGFDPTPFISIFFLLFFALCMGDAGYGLILVAAGILLKKVPSFKDMAPLVVILGVGTVIVGFFLHTFFSIDIAQWKVFEPIKGIFLPDEIGGYAGGMVLAIVVGIIHLCLAMLVKAIQAVKVNGFSRSLGTLGWTLLIVGGVVVGALALMGVLDADATKWIIIVLGIVSAIGIFPLNNPDRNKFANVGLGLWDTYNTVTGLLGDVLSYLRLYALGLAGSMLGMAFNDMGKMVLGDGSNPVFWLFFILLVVIGHTLNIAMCALGAFVHPLRLNFLEFFKNSGYEAAGRNYNPLKKQTK